MKREIVTPARRFDLRARCRVRRLVCRSRLVLLLLLLISRARRLVRLLVISKLLLAAKSRSLMFLRALILVVLRFRRMVMKWRVIVCVLRRLRIRRFCSLSLLNLIRLMAKVPFARVWRLIRFSRPVRLRSLACGLFTRATSLARDERRLASLPRIIWLLLRRPRIKLRLSLARLALLTSLWKTVKL